MKTFNWTKLGFFAIGLLSGWLGTGVVYAQVVDHTPTITNNTEVSMTVGVAVLLIGLLATLAGIIIPLRKMPEEFRTYVDRNEARFVELLTEMKDVAAGVREHHNNGELHVKRSEIVTRDECYKWHKDLTETLRQEMSRNWQMQYDQSRLVAQEMESALSAMQTLVRSVGQAIPNKS